MSNMNTDDVARYYAELFDTTIEDAAYICDTFITMLYKLLYEEKKNIKFYGFGSFKQKAFKEKRVRHPVTKEMITMPERKVVKFSQTGTSG